MKQRSTVNVYHYMDITNYILDNETKMVNTIFLNKDIYDHHLNNENTYNLWLDELYKIMDVSLTK